MRHLGLVKRILEAGQHAEKLQCSWREYLLDIPSPIAAIGLLTQFKMFLRHPEQLRHTRSKGLAMDKIPAPIYVLSDKKGKNVDEM